MKKWVLMILGLLMMLVLAVPAMAQTGEPDAAQNAGTVSAPYTVEFTYDGNQYVMPGDSSVRLSAVLDEVGLTGEAEAVAVSDTRLFSAINETGEWIVTAHRSFSSTEWMEVTINGVVYEITVTDDNTGAITLNTAVLIDSSNRSTYEGSTITGTVPSDQEKGIIADVHFDGGVVVDGIDLNLTIDGLNTDYSGRNGTVSGISLVNGATLHLTVQGENTIKAGFGGAGISVPAGCTLEITSGSTGTLNAVGGRNYGGGAGIGSFGDGNNTQYYMIYPRSLGSIVINGGNGILMCSPDGKIYHVYDHDFPMLMKDIYPNGTNLVDPSRLNERAVLHPVGVLCLNDNTGYVSLVLGKDTAESMCALISNFFKIKKAEKPELKNILLIADGGGANSANGILWTDQLLNLSAETQSNIIVHHLARGTSRHNQIEHKLWAYISIHWKGKPKLDIEHIMKYISETTTSTGLKVTCFFDPHHYKTNQERKASGEEVLTRANRGGKGVNSNHGNTFS